MKFFIILFLCFFSFSFQIIQAAFFCEDLLREVYLVDQSNELRQIAYGPDNGDWERPNYILDLAADQGDTIKINCLSYVGMADTYGGGCFLINDNCRCYNFNIERTISEYHTRYAKLDGKDCSITLERSSVPPGNYSYQYQIPLDASGVTCPTEVLILRYGQNYDLELANYITANFGLKNLEISIIENYGYFELNGEKLESNNRFKILNNTLKFYLEENKKIRVSFTNFGIVLSDKNCSFYIRICHPRCLECHDEDSNDNNHQCKKCKEGYHPFEDNRNCKTKEEMISSNYYFDEDAKIFKRCYQSCSACNSKSLENINNCIKCKDSYHFIYNELDKGTCINETQKPINTYLDTNTNTYKLCYERCGSCSQIGDISNNNCDECVKDNGNYIFHFLENENGKCINESERPSNTYLDFSDNTYKYCFERCSLCNEGGSESNNNCKECLKDENNKLSLSFCL